MAEWNESQNHNRETIAMTKEQVFELMKSNPVFALATAEDNIPHVRMMMLYRADETGIIFNTGENKDLHRQLSKNENVESFVFIAKHRDARYAFPVRLKKSKTLSLKNRL